MDTGTKRILLIDDDRIQFRLTQAHFSNFRQGSYTLEWAATYEEGIARLLSGVYAVCLLDYRLGERDGLQLLREAVAADCRTPIIFLTAESSAAVDIEAMESGALDYLVKGEINPHLLERSLRYALKMGETLEALRRLATQDELTGLLNRRAFDRLLAEETERARRFGHALGIVMIDLDHFKAINDAHGHSVGDAVLREVAARIRPTVRTVDRIARIGGEEFAAILLQADGASALDAARRMCEAVGSAPIAAGPSAPLAVSLSAGSASLPADADLGVALMDAADRALYRAKAAGRNQAVRWVPTHDAGHP